MTFHIAQLNVAVMVGPTDDPAVAEFMGALDEINAVAESSPGFVWRLQTDSGNATDIQIFDDPHRLVNMSVWESVGALRDYVYRSDHAAFFRRRDEWFERDGRALALWAVSPRSVPELDDAVRRLEFRAHHGDSPYAHGFAPAQPPLLFSQRAHGHDGGDVEITAELEGRTIATGRVAIGNAASIAVTDSPDDEIIAAALVDQLELAASRDD